MARLLLRNVAPELVRRLRERAARHGRSAEAEHREILRRALAARSPNRTLGDLLMAMPEAGTDAAFARPRGMPRPVRL
jgi:plasmid stability protein